MTYKCEACGQAVQREDDRPIVRGDLTMRPGFNEVSWAGSEPTRLTEQQFKMLAFIATHDVARKDAVYHEVFEPLDRDGPDPKITDVVLCRLRQRLSAIGAGGIIRVLWGTGWALDPTNSSHPTDGRAKRKD